MLASFPLQDMELHLNCIELSACRQLEKDLGGGGGGGCAHNRASMVNVRGLLSMLLCPPDEQGR